jgi:hypothetical protein
MLIKADTFKKQIIKANIPVFQQFKQNTSPKGSAEAQLDPLDSMLCQIGMDRRRLILCADIGLCDCIAMSVQIGDQITISVSSP